MSEQEARSDAQETAPDKNRQEKRLLRILFVEDVETDADLMRRALERDKLAVETSRVWASDTLEKALDEFRPDLIISDYSMPGFDGLTALRISLERAPGVPVIIATGPTNEEIAVECMKAGADDYVLKDRLGRLAPAVVSALERKRNRDEQERVKRALDAAYYEMEFARDIQHRLYPRAGPSIPGFDIAGASFPAQVVGGDYYDYILTDDKGLMIAVGDAIGHGMGAALLMASMRAYLRSLALTVGDMSEILNTVNHLLIREMADDCFFTLLLVRLNPRERSLSYVNAGHPPGFVLDAEGNARAELGSDASAIGLFPDLSFPPPVYVPINGGDMIVLVTDGVNESWSPSRQEPFGPRRPVETAAGLRELPAATIAEQVCRAAQAFSSPRPPHDDITAVIIKVAPDAFD